MLTMEEAMKQTGALPFAAGNIVKGTVIEVRPKEVLVDIGYKSEGVIANNEFIDVKAVKVGDEIDVLIEKLDSNRTGTESSPFATRAASSTARSRRWSKADSSSTSGSRRSCRRRRST